MGTWRDFVTYPECIAKNVIATLNTIEELIGLPALTSDRYCNMSAILEHAVDNDLISTKEMTWLRFDIANEM